MTKISVQPPSGFRDFSLAESHVRARLEQQIAEHYLRFGFQRISTPYCENLAILLGKGGGQDNEHLLFKILKRGEALEKSFAEATSKNLDSLCDLGLRFELTLSLARYISRFRNELPLPFKVFQIGPVWRAERPQKGRYRELVQCDVDVVGSAGIGAEIECLLAILSVLDAIGIEGVEVQLNDRRLLIAIGKVLKFSDEEWKQALIILDKMDKIGAQEVVEELRKKFPKKLVADENFANEIMDLFSSRSDESKEFALYEKYHPESCASIRAIEIALKSAFPKTKTRFAPTLVRGQEYYTGTIFELRHPKLEGSLGGGGRYDQLLEIFGGGTTPAFGGSLGFERLCLLVMEQNAALDASVRPDIFFPLFSEDLRPEVLKLAQQLRSHGLAVDVYPEAAKLKNQFKYADQKKIPFTAILGDSEWAAQTIKVKNMATTAEREFGIGDFVREMEKLCRS